MPSPFDDLINAAINDHSVRGPAPIATPEQAYQAAAARKNNIGDSITDPITRDLVDLTDDQLISKYGPDQGLRLVNRRVTGNNSYTQDRFHKGANTNTDTALGLGSSALGAIGGLAALGVGTFVSDRAGAGLAAGSEAAAKWIDEKRSDALQIRRRAFNAEADIRSGDLDKRQQQDAESSGSFVAALQRIGRGAIGSATQHLNDGAIGMDAAVSGAGSMLVGAPVSKGLTAVGTKGVSALLSRGVISEAAALKATSAISKNSMTATIGLMESGGAYQQTTNQVMSMSHEDLMVTSPDYRDLIAKSGSSEEAKLAAKTEIATSAGLLAAAITAPTAIIAGKMVAPFEKAPFAAGSLGQLGANSFKEAVEEGIQGGSGQVAQNLGIKAFANENQAISDGVGEQIGTGAFAGAMSTGAIGATGVALNAGQAAVSGTIAAGRAGMGMMSDRLANIRATTAAESPVDPAKLNIAAEEIITSAPQTVSQVDAYVADGSLTPAQGAIVKERLAKLNETISFKPEDLGQNDLTPDVAAHIGSATNKFDALNRAAGVAGSTDASPQDRIGAAIFINDTLARQGQALIDQTESALDPLPESHPITDMLWDYQGIMNNIFGDPEVLKARKIAQDYVARIKAADISEESLNTPKGQQAVQGILSVAQSDPESVNPDLADLVLKHARKGLVKLTRQQSNTLTSASLINRVGNTYTIKSKKLKLPAKMMNIVSREILENDVNENALSAAGHVRAINLALTGGNPDGAAHQLRLMMGFARHLQNKVGALNKSLAKGNGTAIKFLGVDPKGVERETLNGVYINTKSENSIELAQRIALDAEALGTMANEMALLHPDLGVDPIELAQLDTSVSEVPAKEVVRKFRSGSVAPTTPAPQSPDPVKDEPKAQAQPSPQAKSENKAPETAPVEQTKPEPAPAKEPKQADPVVEPVTEATPEPAETGQPKGGDTSTKTEAETKVEPVAPSPEANLASPSSTTEAEATDILKDPFIQEWIQEHKAQPGEVREFIEASRIAQAAEKESDPKTWTEEQKKMYRAGNTVGFSRSRGYTEAEINQYMKYLRLADALIEKYGQDAVAVLDYTGTGPTEQAVQGTKPKTLQEAFPNLVGQDDGPVKNWFMKAFSLPKTVTSRLLGTASPIQVLKDALASDKTLGEFIGKLTKRSFDDKLVSAYADLMTYADKMSGVMDERLSKFLGSPMSKKISTTFGEALTNGIPGATQLNQFYRGKVLNITEVNDNGEIQYNQALKEAAIMAGLQWLISVSTDSRTYDAEAASKIYGVDESLIIQTDLDWLNGGPWMTEAKRTIGDKIVQYWGLRGNDNSPVSYTKGIGEGAAAEVLHALKDAGLINLEERLIHDKTMRRITGVDNKAVIEMFNSLKGLPTAIEQAVLVEPDVQHMGTPPTQVPTNQMHGSPVVLSDQQQQAAKAAQDTPYRANLPMLSFIEMLGLGNILYMFGNGDHEKAGLNKQHAASIRGYNQTLASAYEALTSLVGQMRNAATAEEIDLKDVETFFKFGFTSVGRLQMLGRANPQASKLIREVIMPTWSTLDLTDRKGPHYRAYMLAMAQHLGVKVHKDKPDVAIGKVEALLTGKLAPIVEMLDEWHGSLEDTIPLALEESDMDMIREILGKDHSFATVHALIDYARYQTAVATGDADSFETALYLEADGVTDGPINALMNFISGGFTTAWLDLMNRGGFYLGSRATSLADFIAADPKNNQEDLYQKTVNRLRERLSNFAGKLADNSRATAMNDALLGLMSDLLPELITFNPDTRELTLDRGITKNPLTVTVYGSGAKGIANKITGQILDALYERLSEGGLTPAQQRSLKMLTQQVVTRDYGKYVVGLPKDKAGEPVPANLNTGQGVDYKLTKYMIQNLQTNVLELFARELQGSIKDLMGDALVTSGLVRKATQVQSISLKYAFEEAVKKAVAAKDTNSTDDSKARDFLSKVEVDTILKDLLKTHPMIDTGTQIIFVGGSAQSDMKIKPFGSDLTEEIMVTPGYTWGPENAKVSGIPYLVIATGDGQMILNAMTMEAAPDNVLPVYDGINMPLDQIDTDSQKINEAVMQGWLANPIRALANSFKVFVDNSGDMILSDKALEELGTAFDFAKDLKPDEIPEKIQDVLEALTSTADSIDARKAVMARVNVSVDHMASAGAPYVKTDGEELPADPAAAVTRLNEMLAEEEAKLKPGTKIEAVVPSNMAAMFERLGAQDESGALVFEAEKLATAAYPDTVSKSHGDMITAAVRSAMTKGWKIVSGTPAQISTYARANNLTDPAMTEAEGLAVPADRIVYVVNTSSETLAHELIHAATIETVHAFYADPASVDTVTAEAIQRTEALMNQFMEIDPASIEDAGIRTEFEFTLDAINAAASGSKSAAVIKASKLNEFMAYVLTNQKLRELGAKTSVASKLVRLTKAALAAVAKFFKVTKLVVAEDLLSNLRFNTRVIMASKPKALGDIRDLAPLAQFTSTQANYGNSDRLVNLELSFLDRLRGSIAQANAIGPDEGFQMKLKHKEYSVATAKVTRAFHHAFGMTQQEASLFGTFLVTFGMDAELDGNAQARLNDMFQHVMNKLDYTDFMADNTSQDPNDLSQAQAKFNLVTGNRMLKNDPEGRSTLLPAFLALANVSEEFREILSKMDVPKNIASKGSTLDETLSNLGSDGIDRLARKLSGEGLKTTDLRSALELITNRIAESQTDRELYIEQFVTPVGNGVDKANQWIVDAMTQLSTKAYDALDEIKDNSNNRGVQLLAQAGQAVAGIFNEEIGAGQATFTMSMLDKAKIWVPVRELFGEVIGRTRENAPIYDMIKLSRAFIAQLRQRFREDLPKTINEKFTRALSAAEKTVLHSGLLKTDLATLSQLGNNTKVLGILKDHSKLVAEIAQLEREIDNLDPKYAAQLKTKSKELAEFMSTGKVPGLLLRNAEAVANLFQVIPVRARTGRKVSPKLISTIDKLTSLYALDMLSAADAKVLSNLAANESDGVSFTLDYLRHLREDEHAKLSTDRARLNHYKGRSPVEAKSGASLIVADDREYTKLAARGYVRTGTYQRSRAEGNGPGMGYYLAPVTGKARFNQGIAQNVRQSLFGVDPVTGFSFNMHNVGRITDQRLVAGITSRLSLNATQSAQGTPLMPILDAAGDIVAYERSLAPTQLAALQYETDLPNVLGMWKGRQVEEGAAVQLNHELIGKLHDIWDKREVGREDEFVDLLDPKNHGDPVVADAVALLTPQMRRQIEDSFGDRFMVRKSMINDVIGYRASSIGDFWTGTTRLKEDTAKGAADIATLVFGRKAYQYAVTGEKLWQNFVSDARTTIVVRSVIVPVGNMISNVAQLVSRGVPLKTIVTLMPKILSEVNSYHANKKMAVKLEAEIAAAGANTTKAKALKARLQALDDTNRKLSIWPVIQFGELSAISDATVVSEQTSLFEGNLVGYAEQLADKLPPSVRTAGRYAIISKDTALFQGLQKAVEYGDFLAKAVMYADLTKRQGKTGEEARVIISDEFVNYDRLPGRFRGMLEANGLLWFWHFKLRAIKVALSMARNNPLHALMGGLIPTPEFLGPVGSMFSDNALGVAYEGKLHYSTGVLQGIHAHSLNPWVNLVS